MTTLSMQIAIEIFTGNEIFGQCRPNCQMLKTTASFDRDRHHKAACLTVQMCTLTKDEPCHIEDKIEIKTAKTNKIGKSPVRASSHDPAHLQQSTIDFWGARVREQRKKNSCQRHTTLRHGSPPTNVHQKANHNLQLRLGERRKH